MCAKKDINSKAYTLETQLKLDIFRECFKEWFPVFVHGPWKKLFIYDFFAGSGYDAEGNPGSPIILLEESVGQNQMHCNAIRNNGKSVNFIFNEYEPKFTEQEKYEKLSKNVETHFDKCLLENNCIACMNNHHVTNIDFEDFKHNKNMLKILSDKNCAKFIILDQYGFSHIDEDFFKILVNSPTTDFIFFISSSYLSRFREQPAITKLFGDNLNFDESKPKECHKIVAKYFESLIPKDKEYYLNHFTIKKGTNYYGLIFGTSHTLGMEKFQKVCWLYDVKAGESNCNTQDDFGQDTLFGDAEPNKISNVKQALKSKILAGDIKDNINGLKTALKLRCMPSVFTDAVKELEKAGLIERVGYGLNNSRSIPYTSTGIHKIKEGGNDYYTIKLLR